MTAKSDFTEEEWLRVRRAPFVAGMAISLADPGGPIEMAKETMATVKTATNPPSREQLLADVALDIQSMTQQKQNPLSDFKVTDASLAGQQILDELRAVKNSWRPRQPPKRIVRSASGFSRPHRPPPTPPRKAGSWASVQRRSARARRTCSTRCAPPSAHKVPQLAYVQNSSAA